MEDNPKVESEEIVEESQELVEETKEEESPEDVRKSVIETVKEKIFGKKGEESGNEVSTVEVPDFFKEAAQAAGFVDEDEIKKLAGDMDEAQLKEFAAALSVEDTESLEKESEEEPEQKEITTDDKLKAEVERIQQDLETKYSERLDALEKHLQTVEDDRATKEEIRRAEEADSFFDRVSEKLPVFGKTEELMRFPPGHKNEGQVIPFGDAFRARNDVWQAAHLFNAAGYSWTESLTEALDWYKGKHLEKDIQDRVVKDLKKNETRLSAKRTSTSVRKTPQTEEEFKQRIIEEAKRRAGIE